MTKKQTGFSYIVILIIIGIALAGFAAFNFMQATKQDSSSSPSQKVEKTQYNLKNPADKKALYLKYKDRLKKDMHLSEEQFQTLVDNIENQQ